MAIKTQSFSTIISKGSGGGYRIWIPKKIISEIPDSTWIIERTVLHKDGFKQILDKHPFSKAGSGKRYIPIYCEDDVTGVDYLNLGEVEVQISFDA